MARTIPPAGPTLNARVTHPAVALIAGALCWTLAIMVSLAFSGAPTVAAAAQASVAQQPAPANPAPAQPAPAKAEPAKRNPFLDPEEEEEEEKEQAAPGKPKNPFANPFELDEEENAAPRVRNFTYTGTAKCARCHMKQLAAYREGPHGRAWDERTPAAALGCETCHGPGQAHDDEPAEKELLLRPFKGMPPREANEFCLTCHNTGEHIEWQGSVHAARNVPCSGCHSIHAPRSEKGNLREATIVATCSRCHRDKAAKMQRSSHMPVREGKMDCTSCHSSHGSNNVRLLRSGNTVNESCLSCHAEKRGPFLWEHAPVRESCTTCHDAHGSSNDRMLVARSPMICQRCHIASRHPSTVYDGLALNSRSNRLVGRACANCHPNIHGSNHPSGQFLER
ncbi:MAG TPA: DmsE family decaheme c-type cytochrome [Vicinamibacterales bacterium]|nr:DmsE family decaheme c-type cytochrome [Vicinamibacterales bacterium]